MNLVRLAFPVALAFVLSACSSGGGTSTAPPPSGGSAPASGSGAPSATQASTRVAVTLSDAIRIEPATMTVPAGVPITFVVTNSGAMDHEFYLGDEKAQAEHAKEMASMGGMVHDEPNGIGVKPGQTKELTYTFPAPGRTLAGCHVAGHYAAGMKADITIE